MVTISGLLNQEALDEEYQSILDECEGVDAILPKNIYEHIRGTDSKTKKKLSAVWEKNIKSNCKHFIPEHGFLNDGYGQLCKNKAVIAIGSGASLKKNEDILRSMVISDAMLPWDQQVYYTMAANHQIKPCFESGIRPNFGMIVDGGEHLAPQLDVGSEGKHTILIAGITAHPEALSKWPGPIKFVIQRGNPFAKRVAEEALGYSIPDDMCVTPGGNILNLSFSIGIGIFNASVWMCVGNDLSYPALDDAKERRLATYADGDYSANITSGRDEAGGKLAWAGIKFLDSGPIILSDESKDTYMDLELVYTAPQYVVYKTWLEWTSYLAWRNGAKFVLYNCTEGGTLGVLLKPDARAMNNYNAKFNKESWYLMDDLPNSRWRTRRLEKAHNEFMGALYSREQLKRGILI